MTISTKKNPMRSFRLSQEAIDALENLAKRFSYEAKIKISMTKIIEIAVFNAEYKTLDELLQFEK